MTNTTALTRQEWKDAELRQAEMLGKLDAIASDIRDLHAALLAGFERLETPAKFVDLHFQGAGKHHRTDCSCNQRLLTASVEVQNVDLALQILRAKSFVGDVIFRPETHNSSPSVDGTSTATVGDGQVTGVETAAPVTNAGVDLVLITLAEQLRTALIVERDAKSNHRSTKVTHQVASKILEDAQRAVEVAQFEIRKHVLGGAA